MYMYNTRGSGGAWWWNIRLVLQLMVLQNMHENRAHYTGELKGYAAAVQKLINMHTYNTGPCINSP